MPTCLCIQGKNVMTSQNVEVAEAKGSHHLAWLPMLFKLFSFWQISLQLGSWYRYQIWILRQLFTPLMSQLHIYRQNVKSNISLNNKYILVCLYWMLSKAQQFHKDNARSRVTAGVGGNGEGQSHEINHLNWGSNNATPAISPK